MKVIAAAGVAVILVLAGLAALVIWNRPSPPSPSSPCERSETMAIQFSSLAKDGTPPFNNSAFWDVVCLRKSIAAKSFSISITKDYDLLTPNYQDLRFDTIIAFSSSVRLIITDVDQNQRLTAGDRFLVYGMEDHYSWRLYVSSSGDSDILGVADWGTLAGPPTIAFSQFTLGGDNGHNMTANWTVVSASQRPYVFSRYIVKIWRDGTLLSPTATLRANTIMQFSWYAKLIVGDVTGDGNLTAGDRFLVFGMDKGHSWNFSLIWSPTSAFLLSVEWTSNLPKPTITFSAVTKDGTPPGNHSVEWAVVNASTPVYFLSSYAVGIEMDGTPLSPTMMNLTSGYVLEFGAQVRLIFRDAGGNDRLDAGDSFLVYGMDEPHNWRFNLFWVGDVSAPQHLDWATP